MCDLNTALKDALKFERIMGLTLKNRDGKVVKRENALITRYETNDNLTIIVIPRNYLIYSFAKFELEDVFPDLEIPQQEEGKIRKVDTSGRRR